MTYTDGLTFDIRFGKRDKSSFLPFFTSVDSFSHFEETRKCNLYLKSYVESYAHDSIVASKIKWVNVIGVTSE
jgi:hypothetical protein